MALWVGQVKDFYMKVTHYIPKLQGSLQQGMTLSAVTEHEYTQAVEINEFYYNYSKCSVDCEGNELNKINKN